MNYIDDSTVPQCKIEEKKFEWGEPYKVYTPVFCFPDLLNTTLENSIILFGENNFKHQLLMLYNTISNHEESERLTNYQGETLNRKSILELINTYLKKNETLTAPWEKYNIGLTEDDYVRYLEDKLGKPLYYVKV